MRFVAPAVIGLSALFQKDMPVCGQRLHTIETVTNCRVWEIDCNKLEIRLLNYVPEVYESLAQRYVKFVERLLKSLRRLPLEHSTPIQKLQLSIYEQIAAGAPSLLERAREAVQTAHLRRQMQMARRKARAAENKEEQGGGGERTTNSCLHVDDFCDNQDKKPIHHHSEAHFAVESGLVACTEVVHSLDTGEEDEIWHVDLEHATFTDSATDLQLDVEIGDLGARPGMGMNEFEGRRPNLEETLLVNGSRSYDRNQGRKGPNGEDGKGDVMDRFYSETEQVTAAIAGVALLENATDVAFVS